MTLHLTDSFYRKVRTISGVLGSLPYFALSPLNLIKTRLQASGGLTGLGYASSKSHMWDYVKSIVRVEGVRALWNGAVSSFGSVTMIGMYFFLYGSVSRDIYSLFGASSRLTSRSIPHRRRAHKLPGSLGSDVSILHTAQRSPRLENNRTDSFRGWKAHLQGVLLANSGFLRQQRLLAVD